MAVEVPLCIVDAFTSAPFAGNPAAVCLVPADLKVSDARLQQIAAEMNLSETAFVVPREGDFASSASFDLRWFTPTCEVPLCGHATLASAKTVFDVAKNHNSSLHFHTLSGVLVVQRDGDRLSMDMPQNPPVPTPAEPLNALLHFAIGILPVQECMHAPRQKKLLIRLHDGVTQRQLEELQPNIGSFVQTLLPIPITGVIVTLKSQSAPYDFVSRYFAPWNGIPEDPVTGSAHTVLAPYWATVLGKTTLTARQCSPRGGDLFITLTPDDRVHIAGHAAIVVRGTLSLPQP
eukprot:m.123172 g.123172  ORF g.123172 m.123172 type:complete len:290 (-) comp14614_c3_seq14:31-900(-)